ncbi:hypothetical protein BDA99DRAFT_53983 [Phascolomyces articulosus]|uniref:Uncharacterized protein n=1 Tax=Phascolomyces articulosus TaxID=60185 RepID=A0AAD5PGA1_9FUNG|nr:hypothetical protein BDA99DRAFT_53983 [Phascolomyces articulosus]
MVCVTLPFLNRNRLSSMPRSSPPVVSSSSTSSLPLSHTTTPPHDDENDNINTNATTVDPHLQLPKPSSLLLKRSAGQQHHKAPTNLTIFTPSYANGSDAIRSAPLHPRASKQNGGLLQQRHPSNTQQRINKPTTATTAMNQKRQRQQHHQPPATAAPWQRQRGAPQTEFPSPPIVPSQQRYPPHYLRTATFPKTPMTNPPVQQQQQQQQHRHPPAVPHTAYHHPQQYQAPSTAVMPPLPPTTTLSKKQQFLQPFEMLYDNIEQTRQLKTTLDDHIRRSSSLIQTLQSSSTMVEALVRRHVRDAMQQQLQGYSHRVEQLEKRMLNRHHHRASTTSNSSHHGEDDHLDDRNRMTPTSSSTSPSPTPSSNMGHVLSELLERLDRLETKMDTRL